MTPMFHSDMSAGQISFTTLLAVSLGIHITFLGGALLFRSSNDPLPHLQCIAVEFKSMDSADKEEKPKSRELPTAKTAVVQNSKEVTASSSPSAPAQKAEAQPLAKKEEMQLPVQAKAVVATPALAAVPRQPAPVQPKVPPAKLSLAAAGKAAPVAVHPSAISREYTSRIRDLIDQQKEYPVMARRSGAEGTVYIRFSLARDGRLKRAEVSRSSGRRILDNAAVNAVNRVSRFPAVPESMEEAELNFELPLAYKIAEN